MSIPYYSNELIDIAIGIERRGIMFYDVLARSTKNNKARELFQFLGSMEREHIRIFEEMLSAVEKTENPAEYTGEYGDYLEALTENAVFTDDLITSELVSQAENDLAAAELGIAAEKDSILFYYGLMELAPEPERAVINKIITEEKLHLRRLSDLKKALVAE